MHNIAAYSIRIHDREIQGVPVAEKYHRLDNIRGKVDLLDVLDKWHATYSVKHQVVNKKSGDISFITRDFVKSGRNFVGFIDQGETGVDGKIVDTVTNSTRLTKKPNDTDPIPLICHVCIPVNGQTGLVLLQLTRGRGAKEIFAETVNEIFSHTFSELKIRLDSVTYMPLVKEWLSHGQVRKIIVAKNVNSTSSDSASSLLDEHIEEITITPTLRDKFFGPLSQVIPWNKKTSKPPKFRQALTQINDKYDKVEMVAVMGGTERRFQLVSDGYPLMRVSITDSSVPIVNGIPNAAKLKAFTNKISQDFLDTF